MNRLSTPVLLIIFNRPDHTKRCLEAIAKVKPERLLVAADGPRSHIDSEKCELARAVIDQIDWECDVRKCYSDKNLGCGVHVHHAINWGFSEYEELIILEDDCVASPSFFDFCHELLQFYRNDERVLHISGNNFQFGQRWGNHSYYFSKYTHAWGWATWKRAWKYFDWEMKSWPEFKQQNLINAICEDPDERAYWTRIFDQMFNGAPDVWDYKWNYACWAQSGLVILPDTNLVSNIGIGDDATHTTGDSPFMNLAVGEIDKLVHPPNIIRNQLADRYTFDHNFGGLSMRQSRKWQVRLRKSVPVVDWCYRGVKKLKSLMSSNNQSGK